jgi:hypothetical protein
LPEWFARDLAATAAGLHARSALPAAERTALQTADAGAIRLPALVAHDSLIVAHAMAARIVETRAAVLGTSEHSTARARIALAEVAFTMGRAGEADSLARDVLARLTAGADTTHPLAADAEEQIGRVIKNFSGPAFHDSAIAHYQRALVIRERTDGPGSLSVAAVHHEIANVERAVWNMAAARAHFGRALAIRRQRLGDHDPLVASTWTGIAYLWACDGDWPETGRCMESAFAAMPESTITSPVVRALRLGLLGQALRRTGRVDASVPVLRSATAAAETAWARTPHDAAGSIGSGLNVHRELAIALAMQGHAAEAFEHLEQGQSRLWAAGLTDHTWPEVLGRVQRALPADAALVTWTFTLPFPPGGDYPMWACVVRPTGPPGWVRIERTRGWPARWRSPRDATHDALVHAAEWPFRVADTRLVDSLARITGREMMAPLETRLAGVRRLVVAGPDLMLSVPLGMLRDAHGTRFDERFVITYVPSALAFAELAERPPSAVDAGSALLVGAPETGHADGGRWPTLAGAAEELRGMSRLMPQATILTGAEASAARLTRLAADGTIDRMDVLHLATHIDLNRGRPMQSALILAPDRPGDSLVSRVTAERIAATWHVNARLVDLAGCRSALGFLSPSEGWLGLHNAFLAAGAQNVLVSLWHVDDDATRRLMLEFHARLLAAGGPHDPALALQQAQRAVREWRAPDGSTPFAHPIYWAGFALVGADVSAGPGSTASYSTAAARSARAGPVAGR